jgi:hypothetical protein
LEEDDLGPELLFRQDRSTHGFIEPRMPMSLVDYGQALARLKSRWQLFCS